MRAKEPQSFHTNHHLEWKLSQNSPVQQMPLPEDVVGGNDELLSLPAFFQGTDLHPGPAQVLAEKTNYDVLIMSPDTIC